MTRTFNMNAFTIHCLFCLSMFVHTPLKYIPPSEGIHVVVMPLQVLVVQYLGYCQPVKLHAEVHFPNLNFSSTVLDFGYVLNNSETQRQILMTNCSPLPVSYTWTVMKEHNDNR